MEMDFILLDIRNFLKKLENGQQEIEAGQWEMHRDLTNMKSAIGDLKNLKEDVEKMRLSSIQQMNLIKAVQEKISSLEQNGAEASPVAEKFEKVSKRPSDRWSSPEDHKKRKNCLSSSEEIVEITSQISNDKSDSKAEESKAAEKFENDLESDSVKYLHRKSTCMTPSQSKSNSQCSFTTRNNILQRYLEDSVKYVDNKKSEATKLTGVSSIQDSSKNSGLYIDSEHTPFWDEFGNKLGFVYEDQKPAKKRDFSKIVEEEEKEEVVPKKLLCPTRSRKLPHKAGIVRRGRKRRRATVYSKTGMMHQLPSLYSAGFKCSYCDQICSTAEKLTSHLRDCRTIVRHHFRRI